MSTGRLRPTEPRSSAATELAERALTGARVFVDITIPRTEIRGKMRLVSRAELFAINATARRELQEAGFPVDGTAITALGASEQWQYEIGARTLAIAVREPGNVERALASVEEWRECDDDQIAALYQQYTDLAHRIDPLGDEGNGLTEIEIEQLTAAAKKKDSGILISFGSRKLASFILTSAEQLARSVTPTS
jgi:hypothetical protein